jgi:hypothetical protein
MTLTEDAARAMMILGTLVEDRGQAWTVCGKDQAGY